VDPDPGPVLANYGLDTLRFVKPVQPGETIKVRLTAKDKSPRKQYGEVRWDVEIMTDKGETAATYELLTMNGTGLSFVSVSSRRPEDDVLELDRSVP
jgi:oxepin-CoA hydrolase/3-oxo-5,6-dehydrosuberyl-CoA semialdehyde dehydrogenase